MTCKLAFAIMIKSDEDIKTVGNFILHRLNSEGHPTPYVGAKHLDFFF